MEIVRQVLLLRFSLHLRNQVVKALNETERPIAAQVREALHKEAGLRDVAQVRQLDALIAQINALRAPVWEAQVRVVEQNLTTVAEAEAEDQRDLYGFLLPGIDLVVPMLVGTAALAVAFNGRVLRQWLSDARQAEATRVRTAVYAAVGAGETPASVARRIVGTARLQGRDGVTQVTRNHIDTIVRSGALHFTAQARDQFYRANGSAQYPRALLPGLPSIPVPTIGGQLDPAIVEARRQVREALGTAAAAGGAGALQVFVQEQYVAVLDSRTTKLCRRLDGHRYPIGEGPIPPLHPNCRSIRIVVLPESLGGPVFDPGTYSSWFKAQPPEVREMLRGTAKGDDGELADGAFRDYGAHPMTLSETREEGRRLLATY